MMIGENFSPILSPRYNKIPFDYSQASDHQVSSGPTFSCAK